MGHAATSAGKKHEGLWPDGDATTRLRGSIGGRGRSRCYGDDQTRYLHPCAEIGLEEVAKMRKARVYCVLSRCRLFGNTSTFTSFSTAADKHVPVNIERFFGFLSKHVSDMQKYPLILRNILPPASVCLCFIQTPSYSPLSTPWTCSRQTWGGGGTTRLKEDGESGENEERERGCEDGAGGDEEEGGSTV